MRTHERVIVGHHLIWTGKNHWLPNDPRGSGSEVVHKESLAILGPVHHGRKRVQPSREELKSFHQKATPLLDFETIWFDEAKRQVVANAFEEVVRRNRYTVWACAILSNHVHLVIRKHRDDALMMWNNFAEVSRDAMRKVDGMQEGHPVWSDRPYKVFLYTPDDVRGRVKYVEDNPEKEGLPQQAWEFVTQYNNWPFHKKSQ